MQKSRNRWYLRANDLFEGERPAIEWNNVLELGMGTKHQRAYLIKSFKGLIHALIKAPRINKGHLSHGTVLNWVFTIQRMVRWMVERDIWRFSALTEIDLYSYIQWCRSAEKGGDVSDFTFSRKVALLEEMWILRKTYPSGLGVNPLLLLPARPRHTDRQSTWKSLDEVAALALIGDAIRWIDAHADYLLDVSSRIWSIDRRVATTVDIRKKAKTELYRQLAEELNFQKIAKEVSVEGKKNTAFLCLRRALTLTEGACVLLILFVVGLRIRELSRLNSGCLRVEHIASGEVLARIHGVAAKQDGKARSWISCEAVNKAISYLEAFYSNARKNAGVRALFITRRTGSIPAPGFKMYRAQPYVLRSRMVAFAQSPHRLGAPSVGRLHPHRARKTFARFVVLRDKRALESLAYHFGHIHREVTDGSYVGRDIELVQLLAEENRKDLASGLTDLMSAPHVGGKAGQMLATYKKNNSSKLRGKLGLQKMVEGLIEKGVHLAPCDWGYCVYSQALSACLGDANGPNRARRSADVCSTCSNFAVTERHRAWWEKRFEADETFQRQAALPSQTVQWVGRRLENTARVIRGLNQNYAKKVTEDDSSEKG